MSALLTFKPAVEGNATVNHCETKWVSSVYADAATFQFDQQGMSAHTFEESDLRFLPLRDKDKNSDIRPNVQLRIQVIV